MMLVVVIPLLSLVSPLPTGYSQAHHQVRGEMAVKLTDLLLNSEK